ncbi:uncharacterized protein METZ01_LOCUS168920 [marine metagenome]|uniref:Uncharacterized protein n=1 Tax=marine metagenome TaxID=408172 RepID=A0A382BQF7_9ZZZZ
MNEKIEKLEKQLGEIKNQHKQLPQGSVERLRLLHKWEDIENEIKELLLGDGVELNSWDW